MRASRWLGGCNAQVADVGVLEEAPGGQVPGAGGGAGRPACWVYRAPALHGGPGQRGALGEGGREGRSACQGGGGGGRRGSWKREPGGGSACEGGAGGEG